MPTELIDTTEMYLRTVWELEEEGIIPLRARLVERLGLAAPSVSETVARLVDRELLRLIADGSLVLTDAGRAVAVSVMRKHRLAERLLADVISLDWERIHPEACRLEHVISDEVEAKLVELLGAPATCPHGNPIPGSPDGPLPAPLPSLAEAASGGGTVRVARISEQLQADVEAMRRLVDHGLGPGTRVRVGQRDGKVVVWIGAREVLLEQRMATLLYVSRQT